MRWQVAVAGLVIPLSLAADDTRDAAQHLEELARDQAAALDNAARATPGPGGDAVSRARLAGPAFPQVTQPGSDTAAIVPQAEASGTGGQDDGLGNSLLQGLPLLDAGADLAAQAEALRAAAEAMDPDSTATREAGFHFLEGAEAPGSAFTEDELLLTDTAFLQPEIRNAFQIAPNGYASASAPPQTPAAETAAPRINPFLQNVQASAPVTTNAAQPPTAQEPSPEATAPSLAPLAPASRVRESSTLRVEPPGERHRQ